MLWAVTGCSGTGASTVASVWKEMGAEICSLDQVGHRFLDRDSVKRQLQELLDLDNLESMSSSDIRKTLRDTVFRAPAMLESINCVLHPRLKKWCSISASMLQEKPGVHVLDAALVFELELENIPDFIVAVSDSRERTIARLQKRDGISLETAQGRWQNQTGIRDKSRRSHFVILNEGSLEDLREKAINFYKDVIQKMEDAQWHTKHGRN